MISVVIPLYNKEASIANTMKSVLAQTYADYEVIVVNDGSTDGSMQVLSQFQDSRLHVINKENGGVSSARNAGIAAAHGEYIALLDADDEWCPDYLDHMAGLALQHPECDVVACRYQTRYDDGSVHPITLNKLHITQGKGIMGNYFEVASCSHPPIWTSAIMVRKLAMETVGRFPEGITSGEDLLTWARLACRYKIAYDNTYCGATFCIKGESLDTDLRRHPEKNDYVGQQLMELYRNNSKIAGLKRYVSLWYKMRSSIFMQASNPIECIRNGAKALAYYPLNYKCLIYMVLSFMPRTLRKKILKLLAS
jgi:Glycosyltransferases involved in cell wall biogenesis